MKTFFTIMVTFFIICSLNLGQGVAAPFPNGSNHSSWIEPIAPNTVDPMDNRIQLVQGNLWNPDYSGKKGQKNEGRSPSNDSNNRSNKSDQNQMWNPDYRKEELRKHNDMDERRAIREQVYDNIFSSPKGSSSNRSKR